MTNVPHSAEEVKGPDGAQCPNRKPRYAMLPLVVIRDPDLTLTELRLFGELQMRAYRVKAGGESVYRFEPVSGKDATITKIAEALGFPCSDEKQRRTAKRRVQRASQLLVGRGYLRIMRGTGRGKANSFDVNPAWHMERERVTSKAVLSEQKGRHVGPPISAQRVTPEAALSGKRVTSKAGASSRPRTQDHGQSNKAAPSASGRLIPSASSGGTARPEIVVFVGKAGQITQKQAVAITGEKPAWGLVQWRDLIKGYEGWLGRSDVRPRSRAALLRDFVKNSGEEVVAAAEAEQREEQARRQKRQRAREANAAQQAELEGRRAESGPSPEKAATARGELAERKRVEAKPQEERRAQEREALLADIPRHLEAGNLPRAALALKVARGNGWSVPADLEERCVAAGVASP